MAWYWILCIVLASLIVLILLLSLGVCLGLVRFLSHPHLYSRAETKKYDEDKGILKYIDLLKREDVEIKMSDGYIIHGDISYIGNRKKFVICAHGYTVNRENQLKYAQEYARLGYSVLLYDHRGEGDNKRVPITMGYLEQRDLHEIIQWLYQREGSDIEIGIHGESMGAATVLLVLKYNDPLKFAVADCPYSSLNDLFPYQMKCMHVPSILLKPSSALLKMIHGYSFDMISPADNASESKVPLMLITGDHDGFIPPEESQIIYDHKKCGYKELHFVKDADHAMAYTTDPVKYAEYLKEFLAKVENL